MGKVGRWILLAVAGFAVIALLVWARGTEHHRGDDVGAIAVLVTTVDGADE